MKETELVGGKVQFRAFSAEMFNQAVLSITVSPMLHENRERIREDIPYDPVMIQKITTASGACWSAGSGIG